MNKILIYLTVLCFFIQTLIPLDSNGKSNIPHLLVMGDSISSGWGLEGYKSGVDNESISSYGNILSKELGCKLGDSYLNLSVDGETTSGLLWRLSNLSEKELSGFDAVIISSGGNDLIDSLLPSAISLISEFTGNSYKSTDILKKLGLASKGFMSSTKRISDSIYSNLDSALGIIKKNNPEAFISILSIYDPFKSAFDSKTMELIDTCVIAPCIDMINSRIKDAAEKNGVEFIDISKSFKSSATEYTNIKKFDIHPSAQGHRVIAENVLEAYKKHRSDGVFLLSNDGLMTDNTGTPVILVGVTSAAIFSGVAAVLFFSKHRKKSISKQ